LVGDLTIEEDRIGSRKAVALEGLVKLTVDSASVDTEYNVRDATDINVSMLDTTDDKETMG
jgi:hypothetical protein